MLCDNCRRAGVFNALANGQAGEPTERVLHQSAEGWHEMCKDINCTCQHVTGKVINPERMAAGELRRLVFRYV